MDSYEEFLAYQEWKTNGKAAPAPVTPVTPVLNSAAEIEASTEDVIEASPDVEVELEEYDAADVKSVSQPRAAASDEEEARKYSFARNETEMPIGVEWKNLGYVVKMPKRCKKPARSITVLEGVSGSLSPGSLLAIIGPSGAGKSSFLDVLAGRKNTGTLTGEVLFNGKPRTSDLKYRTAYITQDDMLNRELTPREILTFEAELRLDPRRFSKEQRAERVESVLKALSIDHIADSRVGDAEKRGISGGERKRVTIGQALVTDPSVLYCDEPTSGVDSYTSEQILKLLSELAKSGKTVFCTIHQPSSTVYALFDKVLILAGGKTMYIGPREEAVPYFAGKGFPLPKETNPADFFLETLLAPQRKTELEPYDSALLESVPAPKLNSGDPAKVAGCAKQYALLTQRLWRLTVRNPVSSWVNLVQTAVLALIVGSIFYQLGRQQIDVNNRTGALFFIVTNIAFSLAQSVATFVDDRPRFVRERSTGLYGVVPYYLSKMTIDVPIHIILPIISGSIFYHMVNLNQEEAANAPAPFFIFLGIAVLTSLVAGSLYSVLGAISPNATVANILAPLTTVLFFLFGGFFLNKDNIPPWWIWLHYTSLFKYSFEALVVNEMTNTTWNCTAAQRIPPNFVCPIQTGDQVLQNLGFQDVVVWHWILVLVGLVVVFRILAFIAVAFCYSKEKR